MSEQMKFGRAPNRGQLNQDGKLPPTSKLETAPVPTVEPEPQSAQERLPVQPQQPQPTFQDASPKPKRRKRAAQNQIVVFLNFFMSLLVLAIIGGFVALYVGKQAFEAAGPLSEDTTFMVRSGSSIGQIAAGLEARNIVQSGRIFEFGTRVYRKENAFKAGEYEIPAGASMQAVMNILVDGRAIQHSLTIVEGMTVVKAFERIAANQMLTGELPTELPPEGSLIADTKLFDRGFDRGELVTLMLEAQQALVAEIWAQRQDDLPLNNINEFVTLASIVEKETGVADERPMVAGVFINRLRQGIRLQSDPTIIYGIFAGAGKPSDRPIYQSDIDKPTPYNTYTIDGLPPGPIAIPGRASLEAVANPATTDALFFVADGTGGHAFARTLEEHNANVARWREIERQREAEAQSDAGTTDQ